MKKQTTIKPVGNQYPELDMAANVITDITAREINKIVSFVRTTCPYPAQCVLEMTISKLQERV